MKKLIPFLTIFLILGCDDKKNDIIQEIQEGNAFLRWDGDYSYDGCGFYIVMGEQEYKPEDETAIADSLKIDSGVEVFIQYELLNEMILYYCGMQPMELDGIILHSMEKR